MIKERYEWLYNETMLKHYMVDNLNNQQLGYESIVNLLNEQSQRIAELEEQLKNAIVPNVLLGDTFNAKHCQHLLSLSDYTKQVRKEVLEQVYKVFTNEDVWKELKDWYLINGTCKELKECLDAMIEEKSVENIAKKFGCYKNFYQQLDLLQGEDK